uniref:Uncharacterized protein n=1 Tax=Arundo donax TaxID=35708 RepID=A0A0A9G3J0_ARUDO
MWSSVARRPDLLLRRGLDPPSMGSRDGALHRRRPQPSGACAELRRCASPRSATTSRPQAPPPLRHRAMTRGIQRH